MQDEWLITFRLHQPCEIGLLHARIDVWIPVVLEGAEPPIETHVDARRLDHLLMEGVDPHTPRLDFGQQIAITQQHR
jgi:hypothetical protein